MSHDDVAVAITTATSTTLLAALRNSANHLPWQHFCERYRPLIVRYAQTSHLLNEADADDAAQNTLSGFLVAYQRGDYDRDRGRLRHWLFGIANNTIRALRRKRHRSPEVQLVDAASGDNLLELIPDEETIKARWEDQWRQAIYQQCMVEVRRQFNPQTVEAFELYAKDGMTAQEVANRLGITVNTVYLAKYHILKRIRELLPYMEDAF